MLDQLRHLHAHEVGAPAERRGEGKGREGKASLADSGVVRKVVYSSSLICTCRAIELDRLFPLGVLVQTPVLHGVGRYAER